MLTAGQNRRSAALGVHSLDHFALTVPDLDTARNFYSTFGLDVSPLGNVMSIHASDHPHQWGVLIEGAKKQLHHLAFGVFKEDFDRFKHRIEIRGIQLLDAPPGMESTGIWLRDPDGILIHLRVAPKTSPDQKLAPEFLSSPDGKAGAPKRGQVPIVRPMRLGHCLIFTRNVSTAICFYTEVLGLRISDRSGADVAYMHGIHGSDHHLIAFARSNAPGLHHCCWDVRSLNEIGLGAMQMAARGYHRGWGMGRHVLGSNYFHYVRDPWGSYCGYSCDMDYIPVDMEWQAGDHDAEDTFYVWGPNPPADWTHNYEADRGS